jgi:hypothetical protein
MFLLVNRILMETDRTLHFREECSLLTRSVVCGRWENGDQRG